MKNRIDSVEVESYVSKYYDTTVTALIAVGLIVIVFSPFIINYFTK